ncbi:MAG TPA: S53 family peptidase [Longilinea sp.]|nr:S53 family peptidase [Longilinea sp.]
MKARWVTTLVAIAVLIGSNFAMAGAAVVSAAPGMSTLLQKGPLALPSDATVTADGVTYNLRVCQVVGYPGVSGTCYDPYQMRVAYGVDSFIAAGKDGTGKTIVIVDAFQNPNLVSQVATYNTYYGLPQFNAGPGTPTFTQVAPDGLTPFVVGDGNMTGWAEEISLDVEWAHAIAPGANIVLELGKDNSDEALISAFNDAVNHNRGDVISMSFGEADTCLGPDLTAQWHRAFVNATLKHITLFASSGDEGAAQPTCDGNSWIKVSSSPASDPLVSAVGGTELSAAGFCFTAYGCDPTTYPAAGTYMSEIAWNEGAPYGDFQDVFGLGTLASGGGFSTIWREPAYQQGVVHGGKMRGEPDVSYNAAVLHGVLTYLEIPGVPAGFYRFGGTSAGSPQWAAITVIADQVAHHDYGFLNAAFYRLGQEAPNYLASFHDVTSGANSSLQFDSNNNPVDITGFNAGKGWDAVTGLGSPKAHNIIDRLPRVWSPLQGIVAIAGSFNGSFPAINFGKHIEKNH